MPTPTNAGWTFPIGTSARKWHYFQEGSERSLCGKYGRFLTASARPDNDPTIKPAEHRKFDCVPCRRKLDATP